MLGFKIVKMNNFDDLNLSSFSSPILKNDLPIRGMETNFFLFTLDQEEREEKWAELVSILSHHLGSFNDPNDIRIITNAKENFQMLKEARPVCGPLLDKELDEPKKIIILMICQNINILSALLNGFAFAKEALYVFCEMNLFEMWNDVYWTQLTTSLLMENRIVKTFQVSCEHGVIVGPIRKPLDFWNIGCQEICNKIYKCGHYCNQTCHLKTLHNQNCSIICNKPCELRIHPCQQSCHVPENCKPCGFPVEVQRKCWHTLFLPCSEVPLDKSLLILQPCQVPICQKLLCGHETFLPCHLSGSKIVCDQMCLQFAPCGHPCLRKCHFPNTHKWEPCEKPCLKICSVGHPCKSLCKIPCPPCPIKVNDVLLCDHVRVRECSQPFDNSPCSQPCNLKRNCEHPCKKLCKDPCGLCMVMKIITFPNCSHQMTRPCCYKMTENDVCKVITSEVKLASCSHMVESPCYLLFNEKPEDELTLYCNNICGQTLVCGHECRNKCRDCHYGRFHQRCTENCDKIFICGHKCQVSCPNECRPCDFPCIVKCEHGPCPLPCGAICPPCNLPCEMYCPHEGQCAKTCGFPCSIPTCYKGCEGKLRCGHSCVGLCSAQCPPYCRICDREMLKDGLMLGEETVTDERFVMLPECGHCIEVNCLDTWLNTESESIGFKSCPLCKITIWTLKRYTMPLYEALTNVNNVKSRTYGVLKDNLNTAKNISRELENIINGKARYSYLIYLFLKQYIVEDGIIKMASTRELDSVKAVMKIWSCLEKLYADSQFMDKENLQLIDQGIVFLLDKIVSRTLPLYSTEIRDMYRQFDRIIHLHLLVSQIGIKWIGASAKRVIDEAKKIILGPMPYNDDKKSVVLTLIQELGELFECRLSISEGERQEINTAFGNILGRWFKCPNSHVYMVSECGGATEIGNCNECGSQIGGESHKLLKTNAFAPEMDGAEAPLYPTVLSDLDPYQVFDSDTSE